MKFRLYAIYTTSVFVGEFEAASVEEAELMAEESENFEPHITVCHQCTDKVGGDALQFTHMEAEEVKP